MSNTTRAHLKYSVFRGDEKNRILFFSFRFLLAVWSTKSRTRHNTKRDFFLMHSENRVCSISLLLDICSLLDVHVRVRLGALCQETNPGESVSSLECTNTGAKWRRALPLSVSCQPSTSHVFLPHFAASQYSCVDPFTGPHHRRTAALLTLACDAAPARVASAARC